MDKAIYAIECDGEMYYSDSWENARILLYRCYLSSAVCVSNEDMYDAFESCMDRGIIYDYGHAYPIDLTDWREV